MGIQNLVKFSPFILKIRSKNQILIFSYMSINSVANLQKKRGITIPMLDLVYGNMYTNVPILAQDIEQKPNSDRMSQRMTRDRKIDRASIALFSKRAIIKKSKCPAIRR